MAKGPRDVLSDPPPPHLQRALGLPVTAVSQDLGARNDHQASPVRLAHLWHFQCSTTLTISKQSKEQHTQTHGRRRTTTCYGRSTGRACPLVPLPYPERSSRDTVPKAVTPPVRRGKGSPLLSVDFSRTLRAANHGVDCSVTKCPPTLTCLAKMQVPLARNGAPCTCGTVRYGTAQVPASYMGQRKHQQVKIDATGSKNRRINPVL